MLHNKEGQWGIFTKSEREKKMFAFRKVNFIFFIQEWLQDDHKQTNKSKNRKKERKTGKKIFKEKKEEKAKTQE